MDIQEYNKDKSLKIWGFKLAEKNMTCTGEMVSNDTQVQEAQEHNMRRAKEQVDT